MSDHHDAHTRALDSLRLRVHRDGQRLGDAIENCGHVLPDALRDALRARTGVAAHARLVPPWPSHAMRG